MTSKSKRVSTGIPLNQLGELDELADLTDDPAIKASDIHGRLAHIEEKLSICVSRIDALTEHIHMTTKNGRFTAKDVAVILKELMND